MRHILAIFAALVLSACGGGGALYSTPGTNFYDFAYGEGQDFPRAVLDAGETVSAKYGFMWEGAQGEPVIDPQHAVLSFMQTTATEGLMNAQGDILATHGAGAFVGERGLELELWDRATPESPTNGTVWGQHEGRCARDVLGTIPPGTRCLSDTPGETDYLTPAPNFQLQKGVPYGLEVRITRIGPDALRVEAELMRSGPMGPELVQRGRVTAEYAKHFPRADLAVRTMVARTPGEAVIYYKGVER